MFCSWYIYMYMYNTYLLNQQNFSLLASTGQWWGRARVQKRFQSNSLQKKCFKDWQLHSFSKVFCCNSLSGTEVIKITNLPAPHGKGHVYLYVFRVSEWDKEKNKTVIAWVSESGLSIN